MEAALRGAGGLEGPDWGSTGKDLWLAKWGERVAHSSPRIGRKSRQGRAKSPFILAEISQAADLWDRAVRGQAWGTVHHREPRLNSSSVTWDRGSPPPKAEPTEARHTVTAKTK